MWRYQLHRDHDAEIHPPEEKSRVQSQGQNMTMKAALLDARRWRQAADLVLYKYLALERAWDLSMPSFQSFFGVAID